MEPHTVLLQLLIILVAARVTGELLAEVGVILLLFEVGLETDMGKLLDSGGKAITVAIGVWYPCSWGVPSPPPVLVSLDPGRCTSSQQS